MKKTMGRPPTELGPELRSRIAKLRLSGSSIQKISTETGLGRHVVSKALARDDVQAMIRVYRHMLNSDRWVIGEKGPELTGGAK